MPWLKAGDNIATHPTVMAVYELSDFDDRAVNEVFGFIVRCAAQAAGHTTDYVIDIGTAQMLGGSRTRALLELAELAGYLKSFKRKSGRVWKLVDDPDFLHMRTRAEIDWERQQRSDNANPRLIVPVRLRDGDACRYCGAIVHWRARKGKTAGTYDHRVPGRAATVDTLVVACGACNAGRRDNADADERYPLREAPSEPYYSDGSAAWLTEHGHPVQPSPRLQAVRDLQMTCKAPPNYADKLPAESGSAGSGRVGSGQDRSGTAARSRRSS